MKEQFGNFKMLKKLIATLLVLVSVASVIDACTVPKTKPDFDVTKVKVKNIYISIILCFKWETICLYYLKVRVKGLKDGFDQ